MLRIGMAVLVLLAGSARADSDPMQDWIAHFQFTPPEHGADTTAIADTLELPVFSAHADTAGQHMVRIALPFAPRAWLESESLAVESQDGKRFVPQVRVLTWHGGPGSFVRRALLTFPHEFAAGETVTFTCVRGHGETSDAEPWEIWTNGDTLSNSRAGVSRGTRIEGPGRQVTASKMEVIEDGPYYLWTRLLLPDSQFPRIVEVKADALGGFEGTVYLENLTDKYGYAPDFGVRAGGDVAYAKDALPAGVKLPHQYAAWRTATFATTQEKLQYAIATGYLRALYPETVPSVELSAWPELAAISAFHRDAMAGASMKGLDAGNIGNMPAGGVFSMNRLNHCPAIFQEYYRSGDARVRDAALAWCDNFYNLSIWWDVNDKDGFGGTRYNNLAAQDKNFKKDPEYMWRSNSAVSFCTKGYDSFLYAYEETGDPRYANALHWQTDYARRAIHANTGEARNIGDVRDFVRLYEMTGDHTYLDQGLRLFRELRDKLSTGNLFSQSGVPLEDNLPFIEDDDFGYRHPFPKPYIMGYALTGLPELARYFPEEPKLRDVIRAVADFLARSVDPAGGWRYPDPSSSGVYAGQGIEHAAQLCRAGGLLESRGESIDNLLDAIEIVLQARLNAYLRCGLFFGSLGGWEKATGFLKDGQTLYDLYKLPTDRDKSRDYLEGSVGVGANNAPDGTVYFSEVLAFYLAHRPADRLFNVRPELKQVLDRAPQSPPAIERTNAPASAFGMRDSLPVFNAVRVAGMHFPLAWRNQTGVPFNTWRAGAREKLLECYGPPPPRAAFNLDVVSTEDRGSYEARKVMLNLSAWYRVPAYLLVPKGAEPFPAVLALHDHGAHFSIGKEKVVRPFNVGPEVAADAQAWVDRSYGGKYIGDELAASGHVVLAIDALFWGERGRGEGVKYEAQQELAANLLQLGMTWSGIIAWDDIRSAEFLASQPEVDPARIAAVGLSMGSHRTWSLCAATDLVKAGMAICWLGDTPTLISPGNNQTSGQSAFSMLVPGLPNFLDYADVASIACPKPMLFFNGTQDELFPVPGVETAYTTLKQVYESQAARDKLETRLWDVPHGFNAAMQEAAWEWLQRQLSAGGK